MVAIKTPYRTLTWKLEVNRSLWALALCGTIYQNVGVCQGHSYENETNLAVSRTSSKYA
jgi:hypothetical protein